MLLCCCFFAAASLLVQGFEVNSIAVPRKAKDAVGAITKLVRGDGTSITVNVEYNQLEPLLKASGHAEGDVNDASGFSPYPGNINQLIFAVTPYVRVLERTGVSGASTDASYLHRNRSKSAHCAKRA